ncbi:MAG: hypothetical protein NVSMB39_4580 [Candidatus Saccharimonadales bacterium]
MLHRLEISPCFNLPRLKFGLWMLLTDQQLSLVMDILAIEGVNLIQLDQERVLFWVNPRKDINQVMDRVALAFRDHYEAEVLQAA